MKRTCRAWFAVLGFALMAFFSSAANASMGGIDHLADNLSVNDFWVNGAAGFQAGSGNAGAPSPALPEKWHPGLTAHVVWYVRDWEHDTSSKHEADVPVDPYTEDGDLWVHFLANGTVRVVVSNVGPYAPNYPGPHDPIPQKEPWDTYPPRIAYGDVSEQFLDTQLIHKRCDAGPDPATCVKKARDKLLDAERADPALSAAVRDDDDRSRLRGLQEAGEAEHACSTFRAPLPGCAGLARVQCAKSWPTNEQGSRANRTIEPMSDGIACSGRSREPMTLRVVSTR